MLEEISEAETPLASLTIENYVKTIYQVCSQEAHRRATTGEIAAALGVAPGTVTSMLKTLQESKLVDYAPYEGVQLTDSGSKLALRVIRRHRLIELFLVQTLNLSWDVVHDEAENMEHAVSDLLVDRIEEYLGYPEADPHGDPIPKADGTVATSDRLTLAELGRGDRFRLVRVADQSSDFLRYLSDTGLPLGTTGVVGPSVNESGMMTLKIDGSDTSISLSTAEKLIVQTV